MPDDAILPRPAINDEADDEISLPAYSIDRDTDVTSADHASDQDDWYRSHQDGWFYDDE